MSGSGATDAAGSGVTDAGGSRATDAGGSGVTDAGGSRATDAAGSGVADAVGALRRAILAGDLVPGQRLVEPELAEALRVSRGAVRAALIDLAAEGLVERVRNRGARVRVVSLAEAIAILECRQALEALCAAKAARNVTDEQIAELTDLGDQMRQAVAGGEPTKYSALNDQLHQRVRELADQPVAADLLRRLNAQIVRHQFRLALRPGRPQTSLPEHLAIIDAVAARDPEAAQAAARAHLASVIAALTEAS
jgi:DNA-binding GntR family transcriptional regulator